MKKIMVLPELCDGCKDCEKACEKLYGKSRISIREYGGLYFGISCQHCEDAPCARICPTESIGEEGVVNKESCIGCGLCTLVCPFGAVEIHNKKAEKCDTCPDLEEKPCIKACSKKAISLIDTEFLTQEKQDKYLKNLLDITTGTRRKKKGILDILTAGTRSKAALEKKQAQD
jgi:carbon-monoxide dehydrogenase iron sulfur subunit